MPPDQKTIETLVEVITRELMHVLAEQENRQLNPCIDLCQIECAGNLCVKTCFDKAGEVIGAGAERLSSTLGGIPANANIANLIDHTLLKPEATTEQVTQLCSEALQYGFASVVVNPTHVKLCAQLLRGSKVKVCATIGFPLGATLPEIKVYETQFALQDGATEVDMVINIGALKAKNLELVARDIRGVVKTAHTGGALVKVIIEAALLTDEEKTIACLMAKEVGADYVKTSTGFSTGGATVYDVTLMRQVVGPGMGVKAAGGIKTREDAAQMVKAGATRIGASASVKIVGNGKPTASQAQPEQKGY